MRCGRSDTSPRVRCRPGGRPSRGRRSGWSHAWTGGRRAVHLGNITEFQAQFGGVRAESRRSGAHYACLATFASPHPAALVLPKAVPGDWTALIEQPMNPVCLIYDVIIPSGAPKGAWAERLNGCFPTIDSSTAGAQAWRAAMPLCQLGCAESDMAGRIRIQPVQPLRVGEIHGQ